MGRRVAFVASSHRLVRLDLSDDGETACQASRLVLQVRRAHFRGVLLLRWCHLKHLSVINQSYVLSGGGRFTLCLELELQSGRTRLLRRPLQALKLLLGLRMAITRVASFQGVEVVNGAPWRRAQNILGLLALPLLAVGFRLHVASICCFCYCCWLNTSSDCFVFGLQLRCGC